MTLPELVLRRLVDSDVVALGLRHLVHPVRADEQLERHHGLWLEAVRRHDVPTHEEVVELVGPADLDVGSHRDRVVALRERVQELGYRDRLRPWKRLPKSSRSSSCATVPVRVSRTSSA